MTSERPEELIEQQGIQLAQELADNCNDAQRIDETLTRHIERAGQDNHSFLLLHALEQLTIHHLAPAIAANKRNHPTPTPHKLRGF